MEDVRIYDFDFGLLHIEHDIHSVNWHLLGNDIGTFEMHLSPESRLCALAFEHPYLVAVQGDKQAVITGRELGEDCVLYGRTTNWLLTRFCVKEDFDTDELFASGALTAKDTATLCRYVIEQGMGHVSDIGFAISADAWSENRITARAGDSVFGLIQGALTLEKAGHRLIFSPKEHLWLFEPFQGKTLTRALSEDNKNARDSLCHFDLQDLFTGGCYTQEMSFLGDWDPVENEPQLSNGKAENYAKSYRVVLPENQDSYKRFGLTFSSGDYLFCKDPAGTFQKGEQPGDFTVHIPSDKEGIYAWECGLSGKNEQEAREDLGKKQAETRLRLFAVNFCYGKDYGLQDKVLCKLKRGDLSLSSEKQIQGVRLWYEAQDAGEEVEFFE